jgi:hypothetical protein
MRLLATFAIGLSPLSLAACGGDDGHVHNEEEVISAVILTFTPDGGGAAEVFEFDDPDGDGGEAPTIDPIDLAAGNYALTVAFENRLEDPVEDITAEVEDEGDQHQIFFTGTAVDGPASDQPGAPLTQAYDDEDANGNPIGLRNTIVAAAGTGDLRVTLQHMPPVNDTPVKTADIASEVRDGGLGSIGGEPDVQIDFEVTVQ